ncbi:type I-E CRISPR-associated protein Cas5/CasD [uncultured Rothia sp.]|uniref:type I-E CRISPR-associated protein Cas5/CasD n=1 Tax=uncultured Rothia sp. TaxID=316088 RepID=UPI003216CE4A
MKTLLLKLKGPLQSWGDSSRYRFRSTHTEPTKSGVLGLLAAAQGRARTDEIADLAALDFGVRIDQPGTLERDYQTAREPGAKASNLSTRYYLADAVFIAAVSGSDEVIDGLAEAIKAPQYPLYLGRRSCPANPDLLLGVHEDGLEDALRAEPWHAAQWHRATRASIVHLPVFRDARKGEQGDSIRDTPESFSQENRAYRWRMVYEASPVTLENPSGQKHSDPFLETVRSL